MSRVIFLPLILFLAMSICTPFLLSYLEVSLKIMIYLNLIIDFIVDNNRGVCEILFPFEEHDEQARTSRGRALYASSLGY